MPSGPGTSDCRRSGPGRPAVYRPRCLAATVLHRTVREYLETFLAQTKADDPDLRPIRPAAERALREYLRCGIAAHGFARVYCDACKHEYLVPRDARFGAVLFVHRFGDSLNSHVHSGTTSMFWSATACSAPIRMTQSKRSSTPPSISTPP